MTIERPPQEAIERLENAVTRSKRRTSVRLPQGFVRDRESKVPEPPLAKLIQGGGEVRLKVLLAVLMMATKAPHRRTVSSRELAEMLDLPDPDVAGARRITKAFRDLEDLHLIRRDQKPGFVPEITVLHPTASGDEWDASKLDHPYITLPIDLWRRGWFIALSGRALVMLIILRELTHGRKRNGTWVDPVRKRQYGLSDDTWTRGTKELREAKLLDVTEDVYSSRGEPRRRNVYTLQLERLLIWDPGENGATEAAIEDGPTSSSATVS